MSKSPIIAWSLCGLAMLSFGTSCAHRRPSEREMLSARELHAFLQTAQDERRFWLTRYNTEQGPVFTGSFRVPTDRFAVADFIADRYGDAVCGIEVRLRGQDTYSALIDTSAGASWIEYGLARQTGVIPLGPTPLRRVAEHVNDDVPGVLGVASRVVIEPVHIDTALLHIPAAHGPLTALHRRTPRRFAPLVLGADFLRAFSFVQFNFPQRVVAFGTTTPYEADPDRLIGTAPFHNRDGHLVLNGILNGVPTLFLIDSLGDYALATANETTGAASTDHVRQVILGEVVWHNVPRQDLPTAGLGLPEYARIGRHLLDRFIVTIDHPNRRVVFERP